MERFVNVNREEQYLSKQNTTPLATGEIIEESKNPKEPAQNKDFVYLNGEIIPAEFALLPVADKGLLFGYGLFETFLVKNGQAVFIEEHLARLRLSAPKISLVMPEEEQYPLSLHEGIHEVIAKNNMSEGSLRLTVTAGTEDSGRSNVVITAKKGLAYRPEHYSQGFRAGFLKNPRNESSPLVYVKSLNYLENILGRRETTAKGWNEGLFLNTKGFLVEGTVSNVFLVTKDKELVTPDISSGLLPGVMRAKVLKTASTAGYRCIERAVLPEELFTAKECFLTNSLMVVMPLVEVEGKIIGDGGIGEVTIEIGVGMGKFIRIPSG